MQHNIFLDKEINSKHMGREANALAGATQKRLRTAQSKPR